MGATNQQLYVGQTARTWRVAGLPTTMGNASRAVGNAMEAGLTVQMEATRLLRDVPETALRDTSNATVGNAPGAFGNATGNRNAVMGATKLHPSVAEDVYKHPTRSKATDRDRSGLPHNFFISLNLLIT